MFTGLSFTGLRKSAAALSFSAALALTSVGVSATPARADGEDIAGILAGLAALYVIGRAIERSNERDERRHADRRDQSGRWNNHGNRGPRIAPASCFRRFETRSGDWVRGYGARCMRNTVRRPELLPDGCLRRVRTERGPRNIYAGRCLARNGWQREAGFRP